MKVSDKKAQQIYEAIHEPIMDLRMALEKEERQPSDDDLSDLEMKIWLNVAKIMKITP